MSQDSDPTLKKKLKIKNFNSKSKYLKELGQIK